MSSSISHKIKHRTKAQAKDVFITPLALAKKQIDLIEAREGEVWYDPFRNSGSYYNQYPEGCEKRWGEILDGRDFFKPPVWLGAGGGYAGWTEAVLFDIICSNPPYSLLEKVIKRSIELQPRVISYLLGIGNLTARRIEIFNTAGYSLRKMMMCKIKSWYGMSVIVQFEKLDDGVIDNIIGFDRKVYYGLKK